MSHGVDSTDGIKSFASLGGGVNLDTAPYSLSFVSDADFSEAVTKTERRLKDLEDPVISVTLGSAVEVREQQAELSKMLALANKAGPEQDHHKAILVQNASCWTLLDESVVT